MLLLCLLGSECFTYSHVACEWAGRSGIPQGSVYNGLLQTHKVAGDPCHLLGKLTLVKGGPQHTGHLLLDSLPHFFLGDSQGIKG